MKPACHRRAGGHSTGACCTLVRFESWLRHEVPPNPVAAERVSVSFNYGWF
jgi:hypothetical protein